MILTKLFKNKGVLDVARQAVMNEQLDDAISRIDAATSRIKKVECEIPAAKPPAAQPEPPPKKNGSVKGEPIIALKK